MKRSLALGALMAFVITGSAWAAADYDAAHGPYEERSITAEIVESKHLYGTWGYYSGASTVVTVDGAVFQDNELNQKEVNRVAYGGVIYVNGGSLAVTNSQFKNNSIYHPINSRAHGSALCVDNGTLTVSGSIFDGNYSTNDKILANELSDSYGTAIYSSSNLGVKITDSVFKNQDGGMAIYLRGNQIATFADNEFFDNKRGCIQVQDNTTILELKGENTFKNNGSVAIRNKGTTNFAEKSTTNFIKNELDISNTGTINIGQGATVNLESGINGDGTINVNGGILNGKLTGDANAANSINFTGGTWNITDDSVVSGIVVNGDATIDGGKADGARSSLSVNGKLTNIEERAINHTSGDLTVQNVVLENINKDNDDSTSGSQGSVIYSRGHGTSLTLLNSTVQNNTNDGEQIKRNAVIRVDGDMTVNKVDFLNNKALGKDGDTTAMGGAFYISTAGAKISEDTITNSTFTGNESAEGGAVFVNKAIVNFENSDFNENHARVNGGALNVQYTGAVVSLDGEYDFTGNTAGKNGGAIAVYGNPSDGRYGLLTIDGNKANFTGNEANGQGGAIHNNGITNINGIATFTGNKANGIANDIYNAGTVNINQGAKVILDGGIDGTGTTNINGGNLVLKGGTTYVETLGGDGGDIRFESADAKLEVNTNNNDALKFTASGAVNEAVAGDANALVSGVDWSADTTIVMEAGDIVGEITAELGENKDTGKLVVKSQTEVANPGNQAISDAGVGLKLHYRYHMNDMNKRMGELRNANGEHGVWTRMVRGECEYENSKAQYNQYQLGYDEKLSVDKRWTVGAAVTFSEGDSSYGYGSTEDKSTAFAIYGSKLNNDGTFVDLIARYAHLESDIEDKSGKGDYSTNGMSVSAEFGKRIQQGNGLWIEPQFELTYGNIDSAEFQIGGKTVQVGDMDSLIGRIGFSLGKDIKQGNVYARASYLYDFDGETETAFSNASATRTFKDDLGGGWWEVGVGANINLSKATYIYADVEKTFGGEVDTNWQWNLGVRYSF